MDCYLVAHPSNVPERDVHTDFSNEGREVSRERERAPLEKEKETFVLAVTQNY